MIQMEDKKYYGFYSGIRNSAWRCLLDFKCRSLPVDILKIAREAGIKVVKDSRVRDLSPGENGKSYFDGKNWIIIYNDQNPTELSRVTVAHELGHIFLGHELLYVKYVNVREFQRKPKAEQQADMFAQRLLCPACALWALDICTPEQIAKYCKVDENIAVIRAKRMELLYERNKFLTSPLERELYDSFRPYIEATLRVKENKI